MNTRKEWWNAILRYNTIKTGLTVCVCFNQTSTVPEFETLDRNFFPHTTIQNSWENSTCTQCQFTHIKCWYNTPSNTLATYCNTVPLASVNHHLVSNRREPEVGLIVRLIVLLSPRRLPLEGGAGIPLSRVSFCTLHKLASYQSTSPVCVCVCVYEHNSCT